MISIGISAPESVALLIASIEDYAIYVLDPGGQVTTWNAGAQRIKGYAASEIIGRHFSLFYTPEDREAGAPERELLNGADGRYATEAWRVRKDGSRFWASVVITPLRDNAGGFIGYAKVTRDLTDRRKAEEERLEMQRAQDAMKIRDDFLADAKRELTLAVTTIRVHLVSLDAAMTPLDPHTVAAMKAKTTTLEWSLERIVRTMDKVVALAEDARQRLSSAPR
jgi:PAS domain S-box-containing protein